MSLKVKNFKVIKIGSLKVSFLFKKYYLQKSELYMKPALPNIFEMAKVHDCLLNKNTLFPITSKICPCLLIKTV